jgi:hypothetical protein
MEYVKWLYPQNWQIVATRMWSSYGDILHMHLVVRFQSFTAANMKMSVFWGVAPCDLVQIYRRFRGSCCLQYQDDDSSPLVLLALVAVQTIITEFFGSLRERRVRLVLLRAGALLLARHRKLPAFSWDEPPAPCRAILIGCLFCAGCPSVNTSSRSSRLQSTTTSSKSFPAQHWTTNRTCCSTCAVDMSNKLTVNLCLNNLIYAF